MVKAYIADNKVDLIVLNAGSGRFLKIKRIAKQKKIPFVLEICEWKDSSNSKFGRANPFYIADELGLKYSFKKRMGLLPLADYLRVTISLL
jgi:hypothetical protein